MSMPSMVIPCVRQNPIDTSKVSIPSMTIPCDRENKIDPFLMQSIDSTIDVTFVWQQVERSHSFSSKALSSIVDFTSELRSLLTMSRVPVYGFDWIASIAFDLKNGTSIQMFGDQLHKLSQMDKSDLMRVGLNHIMDRLRSSDIEYIEVITKDDLPKISSYERKYLRNKNKKKKKKIGQRTKRRQQTKRTKANNMSSTGIIDRNIRQWTREEYENNANEMKELKQKMASLESKVFERERVSESSDLRKYALKLSEFEERDKEQQEEMEKNKKIIEELKKEKEEALRYGHRMKMMNDDLEKEMNEMEAKLLAKQNMIDQINDHCAKMEEERDLFASHLEDLIMQKHASIDANPI